MRITRDVISDLWPIYGSGEASADTRTLVEEFLRTDPDFAASVNAATALPSPVESPSRDVEIRALRRTRDLVHGNSWLRGVRLIGTVFLIFAFGRIVSDTTWTNSPKLFISYLIASAVSWTIYAVGLRYQRQRALRSR